VTTTGSPCCWTCGSSFVAWRRASQCAAIWSYDWFTLGDGKPPYLLLPSTGWDAYSNTAGDISRAGTAAGICFTWSRNIDLDHFQWAAGGVVFANAQSFSEMETGKFSYIDPGMGWVSGSA